MTLTRPLDSFAEHWYSGSMSDGDQALEQALRAANQALSTQRSREASRFASIELRFTDPRHGPWEIAALTSVAIASVLVVLGFWFL